MQEFEFEPVPGLPAQLPPGERLLWQGSPDWKYVARRVLHVRGVGCYFAAVVLWRVLSGVYEHQTAHTIAVSSAWLLGLALAITLFLIWVARLIAGGTIYSISNRRVVMRFGIALPVALNIPFRTVRGAALREYADGTGDIPLQLSGENHVAYLHLWPHARPWRLANCEPMLRGVPRAAVAAGILAGALHS